MRNLLLTLTLSTVTLLASCGSGGSSTTAPAPTGPEAEARVGAVAQAGDAVAAELTAENEIAPMIGLERDRPNLRDLDDCATLSGTPLNGSIMYNSCVTPRGTLSGTTSWMFEPPTSWTSTRDLTFTRARDGATTTIVGTATWTRSLGLDGVRGIRRQGATTTTTSERRIETASDLRWSWGRSDAGVTRSWPTGTASTSIYEGASLVHSVQLTFDGTSTVTALINGEEYQYSLLGNRPPEFKGRRNPGRR